MLELAVIAVVLGVAGVVLLASRRRVEFVIRIHEGEPGVVKGSPPEDFLTDIRRICGLFHVERGEVVGIRKGRHEVALRFRAGLPREVHWQIRNAWNHPL